MKQIKKAGALFAALLLMTSSFALAADMTPIEKSWLEFQKLVADQLVKEGKLTQDEANKQITHLQQKLSESPDDIVYKRISQKGSHAHCGKEKMLLNAYAEMTNRSVEDVEKVCEGAKLSVWQLAQRDGKLDALKSKVIEIKTEHLDKLVKEGKLTKQIRDEKLENLKKELDKKG